jgi:hypothetical protein
LPPITDPSEVAPHAVGRLRESGRFEVLDEAIDSFEESGHVAAVLPTLGYDRSQRMTTPRGKPSPLAGTARYLSPGFILMSFVVPTRRFHGARLGPYSADRTRYRSRKPSGAGDRSSPSCGR